VEFSWFDVLMLKISQFGVLLLDCFVYHLNVTCLKRFTRYGNYTGEVKDIIVDRLAVVSQIAMPKIKAFSWIPFRLDAKK